MYVLPVPVESAPSLDTRRFGAVVTADGVTVRVWAPKAVASVVLVCDGVEGAMVDEGGGVFVATVAGAGAGSRYGFRLDGGPVFPDPSSRSQPDGVHGTSEVVDAAAFAWQHARPHIADADRVVYELHIGTFTLAGTLAAAMGRLGHLRDLGVTTVEVMPLHAFAGRHGWGYDPGAFLAVHAPYGTPDDLRRFVDAAHGMGMEVVVDVVLNHLGPDGAYVNAFAPMLAPADTPWGDAVNLDRDGSAGVRRFLLDAALVWLTEYHADGLRLDATSALRDTSTPHFLAELSAAVAALPGPPRWLVAEDLRNRAVVTRPRDRGGYGIDSQWVDDVAFIARRLAGETAPYYTDYVRATDAHGLAAAVARGWWRTTPEARHAADPFSPTLPDDGAPASRVTSYLDTHDQTGNRPRGDRLAASAPPDLLRALTAVVLLAPQTPMLWMGEEWAATTPFPFFCDHTGDTAEGVRRGRAEWYADWWDTPDTSGLPDPLDPSTFAGARLDWSDLDRPAHAAHLAYVRSLLALRRRVADAPASCEALSDDVLVLRRGALTLVVALRAGAHAVPGDVAGGTVALASSEGLDVRTGTFRTDGPAAVAVWTDGAA